MERDAPLSTPGHDVGLDAADGRVVRSVGLACDRDRAWQLVASADGLGRWLGGDVRLDARVGGVLGVRDEDGTLRIGHVVEVDHGRSLTFDWAPAGDSAARSMVELRVEADVAGGSRVTVVERLSGGGIASWLDAGAAWDDRLRGLEIDSLVRGPLATAAAPAI